MRTIAMLARIWTFCISDGVPKRSLLVALLIGSVLNLINQGDVLFTGGHINVLKALLTYTVPYIVATYGAVSVRMRIEADDAHNKPE